MNRLTEKYEDYQKRFPEELRGKETGYSFDSGIVVEKLGAYEDLEEQGMLMKMPCNVGEPVYWLNDWYYGGKIGLRHEWHITESKVARFSLDYSGFFVRFQNGETVEASEFGKTVFLHEGKALEALDEKKKDSMEEEKDR